MTEHRPEFECRCGKAHCAVDGTVWPCRHESERARVEWWIEFDKKYPMFPDRIRHSA